MLRATPLLLLPIGAIEQARPFIYALAVDTDHYKRGLCRGHHRYPSVPRLALCLFLPNHAHGKRPNTSIFPWLTFILDADFLYQHVDGNWRNVLPKQALSVLVFLHSHAWAGMHQ